MSDTQQLYLSSVRDMPAGERLRLAALILKDLTQSNASTHDFEDEWSDEDLRDVTLHSMKRVEKEYTQ